jgi:tRNA/tmRNA/rRNA uracil-C5-methylase (TrmA/RlmC/RlmD family)
VARADGQVVFVRHALPGEVVVAVVTGVGPHGRWLRADAVEVLQASADRVTPPCRWSGPGGCGGCDWQHADVAAQRRLKAAVVAEQLHRLAGVDVNVEVEAVAGDDHGLAWRTRVRYAVASDGRAGLRRHDSHDVVGIDRCLLAVPRIQEAAVLDRSWPATEWVEVTAASGSPEVAVRRHPGRRAAGTVERAAGRSWQVSAGGFWQVHPGAADTLRSAVLDLARPSAGEHAVDLYCGVGLFADGLAAAVGAGGRRPTPRPTWPQVATKP